MMTISIHDLFMQAALGKVNNIVRRHISSYHYTQLCNMILQMVAYHACHACHACHARHACHAYISCGKRYNVFYKRAARTSERRTLSTLITSLSVQLNHDI